MLLRFFTLFLLVFAAGCASLDGPQSRSERPFRFQEDTFAYANETVWDYGYNAEGEWKGSKKTIKPDYTLHCVVMARSARQFFDHARFEPDHPRLTADDYAQLVQKVVGSPVGGRSEKISIPGYTNLWRFSTDQEAVLKQNCGGAWQSYFQRGNWRMVFPFSRRHQAATAERLQEQLLRFSPPLLHVVTFPRLVVNHTVVVYDRLETEAGTIFVAYDPNNPDAPIGIYYDARQRRFIFPETGYFPGGPVNVYQKFWGRRF